MTIYNPKAFNDSVYILVEEMARNGYVINLEEAGHMAAQFLHVYNAATLAGDAVAFIEGADMGNNPLDYARIVRLMDVSKLPHGTKLYASTPPAVPSDKSASEMSQDEYQKVDEWIWQNTPVVAPDVVERVARELYAAEYPNQKLLDWKECPRHPSIDVYKRMAKAAINALGDGANTVNGETLQQPLPEAQPCSVRNPGIQSPASPTPSGEGEATHGRDISEDDFVDIIWKRMSAFTMSNQRGEAEILIRRIYREMEAAGCRVIARASRRKAKV